MNLSGACSLKRAKEAKDPRGGARELTGSARELREL